MAHSTDIVAYDFKADRYCPDCIADVVTDQERYDGWKLGEGVTMDTEANLDEIAIAFNIDRTDERTYDTDEFPKVVFGDMLDRSDEGESGEVCGSCHEALAE